MPMILDDPELTRGLVSWIRRSEGAVPWMYLDTREGRKGGPIVTVGIGTALEKAPTKVDWFDLCDVTDIVAGSHHRGWRQLAPKVAEATSLGSATAEQIAAVFARLTGWSREHKENTRDAGAFLDDNLVEHGERKVLLRLTVGAMLRLFVDHLREDVDRLTKIFPDFADFPAPAQSALLDMMYNLGEGREAQGQRHATGFRQFHKLIAAVKIHDWRAAAEHCHRHGPSEERNRETRALFALAANLELVGPLPASSAGASEASPTPFAPRDPFAPPPPMRDPFAPPPRQDSWDQPRQPIYRPN